MAKSQEAENMTPSGSTLHNTYQEKIQSGVGVWQFAPGVNL